MAKIDKISVGRTTYDINLPTNANITVSSALINVTSATQNGLVIRGNDGDGTITIQPASTAPSFDGSSFITFHDGVSGFGTSILQDANTETFIIDSNYTNGILLSTYSASQPIKFKQGSSTMKVPTTEGTHTLATTDDIPRYTTQQISYIRNVASAAQDERILYDIPAEATGVEADLWFYRASGTVTTSLYIGFGTSNSTFPHASWTGINSSKFSNTSDDLNTAVHVKMFMSRELNSATAEYLVIDMSGISSSLPTSGTSSRWINKIVCDKPQNARIFGIVRTYLKGDAPQIVS